MKTTPPLQITHYAWIIVLTGSLGIFACLGLGRFALGMLLPAMGEDLGLSYAQMGLLSTANFIGYLIGIVFCAKLTKRLKARTLISSALLITGSSMACIAFIRDFQLIISFYVLTGIGSALANIPIMGLTAVWFHTSLRGKAAGLILTGNALAIIFTGKVVPTLNAINDLSWRMSWLSLGLLIMVVALVCVILLRNSPDEVGLSPAGASGNPAIDGVTNMSAEVPVGLLLHCGCIYAIFGFTFVAYATFIVTAMVKDYGLTQAVAGSFWSWVGLLSLPSGLIFGYLSDKLSRKFALMIVFSIQTLAYLIAGLQLSVGFLYLSIACFGVVAWSIPSIMAALAGDYAGSQGAVSMFSSITFIFALGQISGPLLTGAIAEYSGSFSQSYLLSACLTIVAVLLSYRLPSPPGRTPSA